MPLHTNSSFHVQPSRPAPLCKFWLHICGLLSSESTMMSLLEAVDEPSQCLLIFVPHPFLQNGLRASVHSISTMPSHLSNLTVLTSVFDALPFLPTVFTQRTAALQRTFASPAQSLRTVSAYLFAQRSWRRSRNFEMRRHRVGITSSRSTLHLNQAETTLLQPSTNSNKIKGSRSQCQTLSFLIMEQERTGHLRPLRGLHLL